MTVIKQTVRLPYNRHFSLHAHLLIENRLVDSR